MAITSREELNAYAEKFREELATKKKRVLVCAALAAWPMAPTR